MTPGDPNRSEPPAVPPSTEWRDVRNAARPGRIMRTSSVFAASPADLFAFCRDGSNFARIFPERLEAVDDRTEMTVRPGGVYRFRHYMLNVLPWVWEVEIVDWQEGRSYTDQQRRGPLRFFRHTHLCEPDPNGTLYTDQVEYRSLAGTVGDRLIVRQYLRRIFLKRHANMRTLLEAAA